MKYLVYMSLVEPYEENIKKMWKIEKKRIEKGENCRPDTKRKIILALGYDLSDKKKVFPEN